MAVVNSSPRSIEIEELFERLNSLSPTEMAQALYHLEFHQKYSATLGIRTPVEENDATLLMFSRGLKNEIESISAKRAAAPPT